MELSKLVSNNYFSVYVEYLLLISVCVLCVGSVAYLLFVRHLGGILAVANIRGGGEYGLTWHKGQQGTKMNHVCLLLSQLLTVCVYCCCALVAGSLGNKQNCFDDFQCAAEYLIQENYTTASRIAINGASNGGLLIGENCVVCV